MSEQGNGDNPLNTPSEAGQFVELQAVDSTNSHALNRLREGVAGPFSVYFTDTQTAGRGQRGRVWLAEPGETIALSIVLSPPADAPPAFLLGAGMGLAVIDLASKYAPGDWSLKWPNDVYFGDRKAAGILVENLVQGETWRYAVAGIGVNVNQAAFPPELGGAVSLRQASGRSFDVRALARELAAAARMRFLQWTEKPETLFAEYNDRLYGRGGQARFRFAGQEIVCRVEGIDRQGKLQLGDRGAFAVGEIEWVGRKV